MSGNTHFHMKKELLPYTTGKKTELDYRFFDGNTHFHLVEKKNCYRTGKKTELDYRFFDGNTHFHKNKRIVTVLTDIFYLNTHVKLNCCSHLYPLTESDTGLQIVTVFLFTCKNVCGTNSIL